MSRPSLLFVNQHYYPDVASTGQHLTDLAEHLASRGWDVSVLASRVRYTAGKVEAPAEEMRSGVRITRVRSTGFGRGSHVGRILDYATYYAQVLLRLLRGGRDQRVVFLTTPPLLSFVGLLGRRLHGQRYGIWSMDLHPDAEIASGMLREKSLPGRLLRWLNEAGYRGADFIVDLGPYMKGRVQRMGVPESRTATVNVWSSKEELDPVPREENPLVDELGLREKFVVMYSGNAGLVHDFRDILEAMRRLKDDPRIFFLFVGGGPRRAAIERFAFQHDLKNFRYLNYFPREQLRFSLPLGDAHLISLREPFVGISVPGKLYGIMGVGRPALFVGPGRSESADTVRDGGCGAVVDPADGDAASRIVETLRQWSANPEEARRLGERGRAIFLERFEREGSCAMFESVLERYWSVAPSREPNTLPGMTAARA